MLKKRLDSDHEYKIDRIDGVMKMLTDFWGGRDHLQNYRWTRQWFQGWPLLNFTMDSKVHLGVLDQFQLKAHNHSFTVDFRD